MLNQAPKWFLGIVVVALIAAAPFLRDHDNRLTVVETQLKAIEQRDAEESRRVVRVLEKMGDSMQELAVSMAALQVEVKNIKEK